MKKTILVWATVMAAGMLALSGCGKKETGQAGEYTNLADKESRKAVVGEEEHEEKIQEARRHGTNGIFRSVGISFL